MTERIPLTLSPSGGSDGAEGGGLSLKEFPVELLPELIAYHERRAGRLRASAVAEAVARLGAPSGVVPLLIEHHEKQARKLRAEAMACLFRQLRDWLARRAVKPCPDAAWLVPIGA